MHHFIQFFNILLIWFITKIGCIYNFSIRLIFVIVFLYSFQINSASAITPVLDSLLRELEIVESKPEKVSLLLDISLAYGKYEPSKAVESANKALEMAIEIDHHELEAMAMKSLGTEYAKQWKMDEGLDYLKQALIKFENADNRKEIQSCLKEIGSIYFKRGEYLLAMETLDEGLNVLGDDSQNEVTARILSTIGNIHALQDDFEKAIAYNERALQMDRELNHQRGITISLINLGSKYGKTGDNDKAISLYKEALGISIETKDKHAQVNILMNLGNRYSKKEQFDLSMRYHQRALNLADEIKDEQYKRKIYYNIATLHKRIEKCDTAIYYANKALPLSLEIGDLKWNSYIYRLLIECYRRQGDFEKAFENKTLFHQTRDSLFTLEKSRNILEISTKYEIEKKEIENQLLKQENLESDSIIQKQKVINLLTGLILFLVLALSAGLYKNYRDKIQYSQVLEKEVTLRTSELKASNIRLKESNIELERFAYIASHDLKEPLRNIMSYTTLLNRNLVDNAKSVDKVKNYSDIIIRNAHQLNQLIHDVLSYSTINAQEPNDRKELIENIVSSVTDTIPTIVNGKSVDIKIGNLPAVKANQSNVFQVLKNLVENGIKYNDSEHPIVSIYGRINADNMCEISVEDNGIGIKDEYHCQIFTMFKRLHNRETYMGSGLGLSISQKIISKMGGQINVQSEFGKGSTFTFSFPFDTEDVHVRKPMRTLVGSQVSRIKLHGLKS